MHSRVPISLLRIAHLLIISQEFQQPNGKKRLMLVTVFGPYPHLNPDQLSVLHCVWEAHLFGLHPPDWPIRGNIKKSKGGKREGVYLCVSVGLPAAVFSRGYPPVGTSSCTFLIDSPALPLIAPQGSHGSSLFLVLGASPSLFGPLTSAQSALIFFSVQPSPFYQDPD